MEVVASDKSTATAAMAIPIPKRLSVAVRALEPYPRDCASPHRVSCSPRSSLDIILESDEASFSDDEGSGAASAGNSPFRRFPRGPDSIAAGGTPRMTSLDVIPEEASGLTADDLERFRRSFWELLEGGHCHAGGWKSHPQPHTQPHHLENSPPSPAHDQSFAAEARYPAPQQALLSPARRQVLPALPPIPERAEQATELRALLGECYPKDEVLLRSPRFRTGLPPVHETETEGPSVVARLCGGLPAVSQPAGSFSAGPLDIVELGHRTPVLWLEPASGDRSDDPARARAAHQDTHQAATLRSTSTDDGTRKQTTQAAGPGPLRALEAQSLCGRDAAAPPEENVQVQRMSSTCPEAQGWRVASACWPRDISPCRGFLWKPALLALPEEGEGTSGQCLRPEEGEDTSGHSLRPEVGEGTSDHSLSFGESRLQGKWGSAACWPADEVPSRRCSWRPSLATIFELEEWFLTELRPGRAVGNAVDGAAGVAHALMAMMPAQVLEPASKPWCCLPAIVEGGWCEVDQGDKGMAVYPNNLDIGQQCFTRSSFQSPRLRTVVEGLEGEEGSPGAELVHGKALSAPQWSSCASSVQRCSLWRLWH